ncbi:hypothetical protein JW921_11290 [Candidatus Fermentibacterales bacterium]|nr:hypothetical protein [Candidatus Fermentibacterales bacterium]
MEIGEELGDSTDSFGYIADALIDSNGQILVCDEMEGCLKVFDLNGDFIRLSLHRGSGPGEFRTARSMFSMPDGRVCVLTGDRLGYLAFDDSLDLVEECSPWFQNSPYYATALSDSELVMCRHHGNAATGNMLQTVAVYRWGEPEWKTLLWKDSMRVEGDGDEALSAMLRFSLVDQLSTCGVGDGIVYFAPNDPHLYEVFAWDSSGEEVLHITRTMAPVVRTEQEIADEVFYLNAYMASRSTGHRPLGFDYEPEPYRDMIAEVEIGPDSNLWVRLGTREGLFFDIYDRNGDPLGHAFYDDPGWSWETRGTPCGILAWELDPPEGYQKLYLLR